MGVVTVGFTSALGKAELDYRSLWVGSVGGVGGEVLAITGGGGFAKKLVEVPHVRLRIWGRSLHLRCCL